MIFVSLWVDEKSGAFLFSVISKSEILEKGKGFL